MDRLRVAYDVTPVLTGRTGIARYVNELRDQLTATEHDVVPYGIGRAQFAVPEGTRHLRIPLRVVQRSWSLGGPPRIERITGDVDVVHSTSFVIPRTKRPVVATVYDTAPLDFPERHDGRTIRMFHELFRALPRVAVILAVSESVARDLVRHGADPDRIVVTYLGHTALPAPRPVDVPQPFLLTVGRNEARKDQATLVRAFAQADLDGAHLVIAGPPHDQTPALQGLVAEHGLAGRVHLLGAVDDAALAWLYASATAYCFPSVAEGFVTPIVEAMGWGLPIVASDIPPTRELAGDVALLHPVGDVGMCAAALEKVIGDPALRADLASKGRAAAAPFTWERTAAQTLAAYERAIAISG